MTMSGPRLSTAATLLACAALWVGGACSETSESPGQTTSSNGGFGGNGGSAGGGTTQNGEPCGEAAECESGHCIDDVCCNGQCINPCRTCDSPDSAGLCTLYAPATDPEAECQGGFGGLCDGAGTCANGSHWWSSGFGSTGDLQSPQQIASDSLGNVVVVGWFEGTINFGGSGDELTSAGGRDVFMAKLAPDGSHLWSKRFGDPSDQLAVGVSLGVTNNIVIAGSFEGTINFGSSSDELTSAGSSDVFVARFDADGSHLGSAGFGDDQTQTVDAVRVTDCGDIVMLGRFAGTVSFGGPGDALTAPGDADIFLARFLPDGTYLWSKRFGDPAATETGQALSSDGEGNVVAIGTFLGDIDLGGGTFSALGGGDVFVAKWAADGSHLWSKQIGDAAEQWAGGVVVDSGFNVVMSGSFAGAISFGGPGDQLSSNGGLDIFLAKLDADGSHIWSQHFGDDADQGAEHHQLAVDWKSNIVMLGAFSNTLTFGADPLPSAGLNDVYLAKLAADGTELWSARFGDGSEQIGTSVTIDPERSITIVGTYEGSPDFGGQALPTQTTQGGFVARFTP